ncbi:hypothetical protein FLLO111716_12245 [Flavobacterium longum]|uniref:hypothetical protein n=1 Tax=Flavobacterium longum TaxID=1299340 RepID=UPI0039EB44CB
MKKVVFVGILGLVFSCERVKEKASGAIDSGAQAVGRTASDVVNNIDKGISESAALNIELSDDLKKDGLSFGKYYFSHDKEGHENILSLYLITDKDFSKDLSLKLFDKKGVEMGRTSLKVSQKKGQAAYHDFVFDPKIRFEYQGKLIIE